MPRGGPDASCLDRALQTNEPEYLDRDDVDPAVKRSVVRALELVGDWFGLHERFATIAMDEVADVPDPRILELGAGHGGLSRKVLEMHPTHHLPPAAAVRVLAEGTRVADKLLIIDLPRPPSPLHLMRLAAMAPLAPFVPFVHDGVISSLRAYSPSALRALADEAGVDIALRGGLCTPQIAVVTRR
ncbi:methyltransferase type 11 [Mycolicibacterium sp. CBMA 361]|uniref:methyltransferase type 11 n=1 Tax=Mycolicibacterium sp. CBMA 361 TaxID=2606610 RepID=UPI0012DE81C3|nr:methyltransferase type 11 [Mycolicibacterium sp. CBMA 361]MUM30758.1 methyltransferase type 11 [Mycolicibacterium sp. CBMA 361]